MKNNKPSEYWQNAIKKLRAELVQDHGCRLDRDTIRDANGDTTGFENPRAVIRAETVDCDLTLTVDPDTDGRGLDGLSITTFQGLNHGPDGDAVAFFTNGRTLRFIGLKTKRVADPVELHRRELAVARMRPTAAAPDPATAALLADFSRTELAKKAKRADTARRNGRQGGVSPVDDEDALEKAVQYVRERMIEKQELAKTNPLKARRITMKASCIYAVEKKYKLKIQWQALQRHVKSRKTNNE
jgi:hypothetical protein